MLYYVLQCQLNETLTFAFIKKLLHASFCNGNSEIA